MREVTDGRDIVFRGADARRVTFGYRDSEILKEVSLHIPEHGIVGITGRSGSGKSTLLKLLMRFWDTDLGRVEISGENIKGINTASLRAAESFVEQDTVLFHDSIEENVKIANRNATHEQVVAACRKASIHDFIMTLPQGYDTPVGELGDTLSGGERQRLGVARAFLHDAPFILLDEPTSNLDSLNEAVILRSLAEERASKTVVLVSHRASTMRIADTTYSVENGGCADGRYGHCRGRRPRRPGEEAPTGKGRCRLMIELYCRGHHGTPKGRLCPDCAVLRDYADARVDHCPHIATKTFCSVCQTHCYKPEMRERIRQVMRWSGPRMLFHHPFWRCGIWQRRGSRKRGNKILNMPEGESGPSGFFAVCRSWHARPGTFPASERPRIAAGGACPAPTDRPESRWLSNHLPFLLSFTICSKLHNLS